MSNLILIETPAIALEPEGFGDALGNRSPIMLSSSNRSNIKFQPRMALKALMLCIVGLFAMILTTALPIWAQSNANSTGLPLPRFASTRSQPINVRVGPGTRYEVAWIFVKSGLPIEIIQEFDTWRKIRDLDGQEGWIHQNLLTGRRAGYVAPWQSDADVALRVGRNGDSRVRAYLSSRLLVQIDQCDGQICEVSFKNPGGDGASYDGYVEQIELWGVYSDEVFD